MTHVGLRRTAFGVAGLGLAIAVAALADQTTAGQDADIFSAPETDEAASEYAPAPQRAARWPSAGHDLWNTRSQPRERRIDRGNAGTLRVKWVFQTAGDVSATPAVGETALYVPDSAGNLFAIERATGSALWTRAIAEYTGVANDMARTTPAIVGRALIMGDQGGRQGAGARVFAVQRDTGAALWVTKVEDHPAAVITQSPVVYGETVYVGVSSLEENYAASVPGYSCCSFRGSMLALDKRSGKIRWKTSMQPGLDTPGYAGAAVWGSTAVIDPLRRSLYITTGNNYTVPQAILDCQSAGTPADVKTCVDAVPGSSQNHFDSIVSLDLHSGAIKWARAMVPFDSWNISCIFAVAGNEGNCTDPSGEDYDFGQGATLYTALIDRRPRQLLGAGQKSGVYWALDPDDGSVVWSTQVGPGGSLGGFEWGSAIDGTRIYGAISNSRAEPWTAPSGEILRNGFWSALDPASGAILWQTAGNPAVRSTNQGAVSVANGVVFAGTVDRRGTMYALDAASGDTLWTFVSGGSVNSGPAIADGTVYWGSGYGVRGIGISPNNRLYAFVPGADCVEPGSCAGTGSAGSAGSSGAGAAGSGGGSATGAAAGGGGTSGSGGAAGSGGTRPTTWTGIYDAYLGPGTIGRCAGCHNASGRVVPLNSAAIAYDSLTQVGQIDGTASAIAIPGRSRLTWFGGDMPPNGPTSAPDAAEAIRAWVASGAPNN